MPEYVSLCILIGLATTFWFNITFSSKYTWFRKNILIGTVVSVREARTEAEREPAVIADCKITQIWTSNFKFCFSVRYAGCCLKSFWGKRVTEIYIFFSRSFNWARLFAKLFIFMKLRHEYAFKCLLRMLKSLECYVL